MAGSVNKVILIGNLGADPDIRRMASGDPVASFSIATSESWTDKGTGERRERTEWHNVVVFSEPLVKIIEKYVKKGTKIYLEGQLQTRKWQDRDGRDRYTTEVVLQNFRSSLTILDSRRTSEGDVSTHYKPLGESNSFQQSQPNNTAVGNLTHSFDDEIPF